ncbi:MAG: hypothetical protein J6586_09545 [Snodgrassella sp.]|nr:hypothetical protein [Snodgrassella sp.]
MEPFVPSDNLLAMLIMDDIYTGSDSGRQLIFSCTGLSDNRNKQAKHFYLY